MNKNDEIVEVAFFGKIGHYSDYDDVTFSTKSILDSEWVKFTRAEVNLIKQHRYALSQKLSGRGIGYDDIIIVERPTEENRQMMVEDIRNYLTEIEEQRKKEDARREKQRLARLQNDREKQAAKARKALDKAQKTLAALGEKVD